jgi:GTPase
VRDLMLAVARTIEAAPMPEIVTPPGARIELAPASAFRIERHADGAFVVSGERVEKLAAMTNFDSDEALARFERALGKMGVEKRLQELGAEEGDTVRIGPYEFTYS